MNRSDKSSKAGRPEIARASSELDGFGLDQPDEALFARLRAAERGSMLGSIGAFELVEEISRGAQGVVYRARQPKTNRRIAVKRLVAGRFATRAARHRFAREIEMAAGLNHPNVVSVYSAEVIDDQPVLAMEWINGVPIDAWAESKLAAGSPLEVLLGTFVGVCDGVQHAHQRGVIHRDLKPTNILVDERNVPHVLDFGLAKSFTAEADSGPQGMTLTRDFVGTPMYAAPEQVRSETDAIDIRTDVYALGAILYQLLTGRTPHTGHLHELMLAIQHDDPKPPSRLRAALSRELDAITLKALAKNPVDRYQSVDALAADVRAFLDGEVVSAHPPTAGYRLRKLVGRHRLACAFAVSILLLLSAFAVVSALQAERLEEQRSIAESRFSDVRTLARALIFDVHDAVAPLKGTLPAREMIVETGLEYLDALSAGAGNDVALQLECAAGYARIAQIQGDPNGPNLGRTDAALDSCQKSLAITDSLLESGIDDDAVLRQAAAAKHVLANLLTAAGHTGNAISAYEEAIALRMRAADGDQSLAGSSPMIERIRSDFAACLERADRFAEAEAQLVMVVNLIEARLNSNADDLETELKLGNVLASLGHVRVQQGLADRAHESLAEAIDILGKATQSFPDRDNIWRSLVVARTARARAAAMQDDTAFARQELEWVIETHQEMIEADPTNVTTYHDLAAAHHFLGKLLDADGDAEGALLQFEEMLRIRRKLAIDDPASVLALRGVAIGLDMCGATLRKLGRLDEALARHQEAMAAFERIAAADPDNPRHLRSVAIAAHFLGELFQEFALDGGIGDASPREHWRMARDYFKRSIQIMEQLNAEDMLLPSESGVIDMLAGKIEICNDALASNSD